MGGLATTSVAVAGTEVDNAFLEIARLQALKKTAEKFKVRVPAVRGAELARRHLLPAVCVAASRRSQPVGSLFVALSKAIRPINGDNAQIRAILTNFAPRLPT